MKKSSHMNYLHLSYIYFLTFSYVSALCVVLSKMHFHSLPGSFTLWSPSPLVFCKIAF